MRIFALLLTVLFAFSIQAHEEPAKTKKEKDEREMQRFKTQKKRIKTSTVWNYVIEKGKVTNKKLRYLVNEYDQKGNYVGVSLFKNGDSLETKVVYFYDSLNNFIGDADFDRNGKLIERNVYVLDTAGLVQEIYFYTSENNDSLKGWCLYKREDNTITFYKNNEWNNLEYKILYKYSPDLVNGNPVEMIKSDKNDSILMIVRNVYNDVGQRTQKIILDSKGKEQYRFEYTYSGHLLVQTTKIMPDGTTDFSQLITYDDKENIKEVLVTGKKGEIKSRQVYTYEYYLNN